MNLVGNSYQVPSQTGDFISIISPVASRVCNPEIHGVRAVVGALEVGQHHHCGVGGGVKRPAEAVSHHLHPNSALPESSQGKLLSLCLHSTT